MTFPTQYVRERVSKRARARETYQVVEGDALLSAAHVLEEAVVGHQQQGTGVLLVVVGLPLLSDQGLWGGGRHTVSVG